MAALSEKTDEPTSAEYEIGYGKPPAEHRFRKGQSGNPRGRPRGRSAPLGRRDLSEAFARAAREPITVTKDGRSTQITRLEALAQQLMVKALQGDMRANKLVIDAVKTLASAGDPSDMTHEEWLDALDDRPKIPRSIEVRFVSPGDRRGEPDAS